MLGPHFLLSISNFIRVGQGRTVFISKIIPTDIFWCIYSLDNVVDALTSWRWHYRVFMVFIFGLSAFSSKWCILFVLSKQWTRVTRIVSCWEESFLEDVNRNKSSFLICWEKVFACLVASLLARPHENKPYLRVWEFLRAYKFNYCFPEVFKLDSTLWSWHCRLHNSNYVIEGVGILLEAFCDLNCIIVVFVLINQLWGLALT